MKSVALVLVCIAAFGFGGCGSSSLPANDFDSRTPTDQLTITIEWLDSALGGITDVASAESALPTLESVERAISSVASRYRDQSTQTQEVMNLEASKALPEIQSRVTEVMAIPGVSGIIGPTLDSIMTEFNFVA